MIIGLDAGHTLVGVGTGAVGIVKETDMNRLILKDLTMLLKNKGHTVINCTVDKSDNNLSDIVKKANEQYLDLFISIHLNAFIDPKANGVETYIYNNDSKSKDIAKSIQNELVNQIEWKDRGLKTSNFYVLKNTKAPAILLELGFCTNESDMNKFNSFNISKAIFKGITKKAYIENKNNWKVEFGLNSLKDLSEDGIIDYESWVNKLEENTPIWLFLTVVNRIQKNIKEDK